MPGVREETRRTARSREAEQEAAESTVAEPGERDCARDQLRQAASDHGTIQPVAQASAADTDRLSGRKPIDGRI